MFRVTHASNRPPDPSLGWLPVQAHWQGRPLITWALLKTVDFQRPMFRQALLEAGFEHCQKLQTHLPQVFPPQLPLGAIIHCGRCGSTLLSRVINALSAAVCFSEPPILAQVLGPSWALVPTLDRVKTCQYLTSVLGQWMPLKGRRHVIKFTSTASLFLGTETLQPAISRVFLYRDPTEILVSILARPPRWFDPRNNPVAMGLLAGVPPSRVPKMGLPRLAAHILARIMTAMADQWQQTGGTGLLLNYGMEEATTWVPLALSHLGLAIAPEQHAALEHLLRLDAKDPSGLRPFQPDSARKHQSASPETQELVAQLLSLPYNRLEDLRQGQTTA